MPKNLSYRTLATLAVTAGLSCQPDTYRKVKLKMSNLPPIYLLLLIDLLYLG
jgi:hypothetical protein